ncbi:hypothetical protein KUF71_002026 [Frankliniella fusca]|uniref:Integrase catalytic domain-containing protein n=1 Tax=Frankliniella fusca TaxID=407009 RepID=A0AAE1HLZ1_9NEOP|nr:hypothetical protein KUF71_002026 [Frankliniella fusca]
MSVPDALSRLPAPNSINFLSPLIKAPVTVDRISEASLADPTLEIQVYERRTLCSLKKIYDFTYFGWPNSNPFPTHSELSVYYKIRDQLSISEKCLLYDCYSKWIHIQPMLTTVASAVNQVLFSLFSFWGCLPSVLVSDNGPPFCSIEFRDFLTRFNIVLKHSPVYHPLSNGLAERGVGIAKKSP